MSDENKAAHEKEGCDSIEKEIASLKSIYRISIETRNFEITQLINRSNFFMLFQSVLLASIMQEQLKRPFVEFMICITGVMMSYYQLQMASGAKFWQERWEQRVLSFERMLCEKLKDQQGLSYHLFSVAPEEIKKDVQQGLTGSGVINFLILQRNSVSRAPIKVALVLLIIWIVLLASTLNWNSVYTSSLISGLK